MISPTALSTSVRLVTSTLVAKVSIPSFTSWRAVESAPSNFTSVRQTRAPSLAKRRAVASPIPRDAPVTIATLPSRRPNVCRSFQSLSITALQLFGAGSPSSTGGEPLSNVLLLQPIYLLAVRCQADLLPGEAGH